MKTITIVSAAVSLLLIASTMICGLWIKANAVSEPSSLGFHRTIGIGSLVFNLITLILLIIVFRKG